MSQTDAVSDSMVSSVMQHGKDSLTLRSLPWGVLLAAAIVLLPANAGADSITATSLRGSSRTRMVANTFFVPGPDAVPAREPFEGRLILAETPMTTAPALFKSARVLGKETQLFPAASLAFVTDHDDLVPVTQEVIRVGSLPGSRSFWDVIVQPGKVWSVPTDPAWSRAAFPFALVNSLEGETHNGLALFLYRGGEVSNLRLQIVQQTAPYYVTDLFTATALVPAKAVPLAGVDREVVTRGHAAALADAVRIEDWTALVRKVGADTLLGFDGTLMPDELVLSGLDDGRIFYLKTCNSAAGTLPWCDRARFGVWSATKALLASTALLRLAQKYGPFVFDLRIRDYVPGLADIPAWQDVRFRDAISMATGVGEGSSNRNPNHIDDGYLDDPHYAAWYEGRSRAAKIAAIAAASRAYPWGPGQVARYRDQDMFVLGVAMDGFIKSREGAIADLWTLMRREVFDPIGIHDAPTNRTIEPDGSSGQPLMAYGYYPTIGDMVKIARLYQSRGRHGGLQVLYAPGVEALTSGVPPRGLPTGDSDRFGETTYFNAFWEERYDSPEGCRLYIPRMLGWGGNMVALMPGGFTGIRLARASRRTEPLAVDTTGMEAVANRMTRFCE